MGKSLVELFGKVLDLGSSAAGTVKEKPIAAVTSIITLVVAVFGFLSYFDSRYASASELATTKQTMAAQAQTIAVQAQQTDKILDYLKMQALSRKMILEMKQATGKITPEEKVELQNLKEMLDTLNKETKPNP